MSFWSSIGRERRFGGGAMVKLAIGDDVVGTCLMIVMEHCRRVRVTVMYGM